MFEQAFRNIDDVLRKEAGCTTELDYTEQTSWLLFLKYLEDLEQDKANVAALDGKNIALSSTSPSNGKPGPPPRAKTANSTTTKPSPETISATSSTIKNTFLSNTDNASVNLRKLLLESCSLHTVLDCPGGTFQGKGWPRLSH